MQISGNFNGGKQAEYEKAQGMNNAIFEFCMRHNDDPSKKTEGIPERDPAEYEWLKSALADIESEEDRMKNCLAVIRSEADVGSKEIAMEEILYYVEDLDKAIDFCKSLKGTQDLLNLLKPETPATLRDGAANLIGTITQNNIICQAIFFAQKALPILISQLLTDEACRTRLLFALSSCVRGNKDIITAFMREPNGVEAVAKAVEGHAKDARSCKKALFFLTCLWRDDKDAAKPAPPADSAHLQSVRAALKSDDVTTQELAADWILQLLAHGSKEQVAAAGICPADASDDAVREKLAPHFGS
ncbi:Hsp70 nucleotide exchange factor FES1 [Diplonema papillatum]|nr:Hsp70 nucleotide exchange factor FES1 [Diplonema papillatum]|eukprot:gene5278-8057_t